MNDRECQIEQGIFDRWYIFKARDRSLAWTGSQWAATSGGLPKAGIQLCNFDTVEEAREYARENHLIEIGDAA